MAHSVLRNLHVTAPSAFLSLEVCNHQFISSLIPHSILSQSCYLESEDVLRLQMSIIVAMENSSKEFEENTQDLLDHLSIVYVATDKSETSGKLGSWDIFTMKYFGETAS